MTIAERRKLAGMVFCRAGGTVTDRMQEVGTREGPPLCEDPTGPLIWIQTDAVSIVTE